MGRPEPPRSHPDSRRPLVHRPVHETDTLEAFLEGAHPAFGGGFLRRVWELLDEAVGRGVPMSLSVAGPVTASGQHYAWLNPLLDTGWFAWISVTDAICYHDAHRALRSVQESDFTEAPLFGDDAELREEGVIRIADLGFPEDVLLDTDRWLRELLARDEFQRRMAGPEFRHRLGAHLADLERASGAREGLLALCRRKDLPVFVGAPADGSIFLNSMRLWAEGLPNGRPHRFELDLHAEVFESCAYHAWGLFESEARNLGTLVLGGGVPKNFNLQPEPALGQVFELAGVRGYLYDVQITTAPVTDGSLSSCPPAEAVTWGKVDKDHYRKTTESFQCDYSVVMPLLTKALLDKRERLRRRHEVEGDALFETVPEARGYLRPNEGERLFARREELLERLRERLAGRTPNPRTPETPCSRS